MRKLTACLLGLMLIFTMAASAEDAIPELTGHWETSLEETLCATVLTLTPRESFTLISEGVTYTGTWTQEGSTLLLSGTSSIPNSGESAFSAAYPYDSETGALDIGSGLHLYRVIPGMEGLWLYIHENPSGFVKLMLGGSKAYLTWYSFDDITPPLPDGGSWFEGTWWLEGRWSQEGHVLTLHAENGCAYTFTQDQTTGLLVSQEGYAFYNYR